MKTLNRRGFLKHAAVLSTGAVLAAACATAPPSAPTQPSAPAEPSTATLAPAPTSPPPTATPEPAPTSPPPVAEPAKIRWAYWANEALGKIYDKSVDLFSTQNPDIKVEKLYIEGGTGPWTEKILAMIAANDVPDVLLTTPDHLASFGGPGLLVDLKPFMDSAKLDTADFFEAGLTGGQRQAKQVGLPVGVFVSPLYYNKKHLAEVELQAPTKPDWTWDDLVAMAHKLTRQVEGQQRWGFHISTWFDLLIAPRVWATAEDCLRRSRDESKAR